MTLKRRLAALLSALLVAVGLAVTPASPAAAGDCTWNVACGYIVHSTASDASTLRVTGNYGDPWSMYEAVPRGSSASYRDDDGYYIPSGRWRAREYNIGRGTWGAWIYAPATWQKITDLESIRVHLDYY